MTDFRPEIAEFKEFSAPYVRDGQKTSKIMTHVLIASLPSLLLSGIIFGGDALMLFGLCVLSAMFWEWLSGLILRRPKSTDDLSAAITGMVFAFMLPASFPYWKAIIGTFIAIVVFKQLFGGIGKNIFNPAAASMLVCRFIFSSSFVYPEPVINSADVAVTGETSLQSMKDAYADMFLGRVCGGFGEVSVIAILTGAFYLLAMRVISLHEPVAFLGTLFVFSYIAGQDGVYQILAGGAVFTAFFLGCDYVTTPTTGLGKVIFGVLAAAITCVLRFFTPVPHDMLIAILACNLLTPVIDRFTEKKPMGAVPTAKAE